MAELTMSCARCGNPLPPLGDDERALLLTGAPVVAAHPAGQCPGDLPALADESEPLRHFEAQVRIVEVNPDEQTSETLAQFTAHATAADPTAATAAGGPLATSLGHKWVRAHESIRFADIPVDPALGGPDA